MINNPKTKKELAVLYGCSVKTIERDLTEMKRNFIFSEFICRPSYRRIYIDAEGYQKFLEFKEREYKKTL